MLHNKRALCFILLYTSRSPSIATTDTGSETNMQSPQTPSVMFKLFIWKRSCILHIACSQPVKWNRNGDSRIIDQNSKWAEDEILDCLSSWSECNKTKRNQLFIYWYAWYLTPKLCADKNWIRGSVSNIILFRSKFTCFSFSLWIRDELSWTTNIIRRKKGVFLIQGYKSSDIDRRTLHSPEIDWAPLKRIGSNLCLSISQHQPHRAAFVMSFRLRQISRISTSIRYSTNYELFIIFLFQIYVCLIVEHWNICSCRLFTFS